MRKPFSVIDKPFLRRILWMLILALFSVLIFWQQTRAAAVDPAASGAGLVAFVVDSRSLSPLDSPHLWN